MSDFSFISQIKNTNPSKKVVALLGNPNVGKSTVFNALTGLRQHTGNWPGKTVDTAFGECNFKNFDYTLVDLPGTYSLKAHSPEEEVARDFIKSGEADAVIVICDALCLERNLNLVIQALSLSENIVVGVNLMDEAKKQGIKIDLDCISKRLGIPVIPLCARQKKGLLNLLSSTDKVIKNGNPNAFSMRYPSPIENAVNNMGLDRSLCISLLEGEESPKNKAETEALVCGIEALLDAGIKKDKISDIITSSIILTAEGICADTVTKKERTLPQLKADRLITGRLLGYPLMLMLLALVFWITIWGANYPSSLLSSFLLGFEDDLYALVNFIHLPSNLSNMLISGVYRCLSWVVSVMLPPMAIFFPLFTLLEDFGYLPRVAFNLDHIFKKCRTCGKQALTMCMGLGCNAAGVVGCRIIDSPRERLIAIITNSLVPCNGRFPTIISVTTMFFAVSFSKGASVISAIGLTVVISLGISLTFLLSAFLSKTLLKGEPSSFAMELPPYRRPLIIKTLSRSILDRTLFVLGRAAAVAAPAGLLIWIMANVTVSGATLLSHFCTFLDPLGSLMGLDGVMLMAFILGFPANEIVMPIAIMAYMSGGTLSDIANLALLKELLISNGWTPITAICTIVFSLVHFPCSTTCITIYKETKSIKWTALSIALPTALGMVLCILINLIGSLFI